MAKSKTIGVSPITNTIFIGTLNKNKNMWVGEKEDITVHFNQVLNQYIKPNEVMAFKINGEISNTIINVKNTKIGIKKTIKYLKKLELKIKDKEL